MVRVLKSERLTNEIKYIEAAGLSTDTKPTEGISTGSLFNVVDTGEVYAYAEGNPGAWHKIKDGPISSGS